MDGLDIRRAIEQRLISSGKDASPQTIDLVAQRLLETRNPDFVRRFLEDPREPVPDWVPAEAAAGGVGSRLLDIAQEATAIPARMVQGTAELASWLTGGRVGADLAEDRARRLREFEEQSRSPQMKRDLAEIEQAEGAMGVLKALAANPSAAALIGTESLGPMLAGGAAAAPIRALGVVPAVARAAPWLARLAPSAGEGLIAGAMEDGDPTTKALVAASTMVIGRMGAGLARRMGLSDIDAIVTGQVTAAELKNVLNVGAKVLGSAAVEGILEEAPQEAAQTAIVNLRSGRPWNEGVEEAAALGGAIGFGMGGAAAMLEIRRAGGDPATAAPPAGPETERPDGAEPAGGVRIEQPPTGDVAGEVDTTPAPTPEGEPGWDRGEPQPSEPPYVPDGTKPPEPETQPPEAETEAPPAEPKPPEPETAAPEPAPWRDVDDAKKNRIGRVRKLQDGQTEAQLPDDGGSQTFPTAKAARAWLRREARKRPTPAAAPEPEAPAEPEWKPSNVTPRGGEDVGEVRIHPDGTTDARRADTGEIRTFPTQREARGWLRNPDREQAPPAEPEPTEAESEASLVDRIDRLIRIADAKGNVTAENPHGEWGLGNNPAAKLRTAKKHIKAAGAVEQVDAIEREFGLTGPDPGTTTQDLRGAIEAAYRKHAPAGERSVTEYGDFGGWVELADIRKELGEQYPRADVDAELVRMFRDKVANLTLHEDPVRRIRGSQVRLGVENMDLLSLPIQAQQAPAPPLDDATRTAAAAAATTPAEPAPPAGPEGRAHVSFPKPEINYGEGQTDFAPVVVNGERQQWDIQREHDEEGNPDELWSIPEEAEIDIPDAERTSPDLEVLQDRVRKALGDTAPPDAEGVSFGQPVDRGETQMIPVYVDGEDIDESIQHEPEDEGQWVIYGPRGDETSRYGLPKGEDKFFDTLDEAQAWVREKLESAPEARVEPKPKPTIEPSGIIGATPEERAAGWVARRDWKIPARWRKLPDGRIQAEKIETGEGYTFDYIEQAHNWLHGRDDLPATATKYPYSSTQVDVPPDSPEGKAIAEFQATIDKADLAPSGLETEPHVTVLYGLHTADVEDVQTVLEGQVPVDVTIQGITTFPDRGDGVVLKADIKSPDLRALHARLKDELPYTSDFPEYNPHLTIAYLKPGTEEKYTGIAPKLLGKKIRISELVFSSKTGDQTSLPLKGDRPAERKVEPIEPAGEFKGYRALNQPIEVEEDVTKRPFRFEHDGGQWWSDRHTMWRAPAPPYMAEREDASMAPSDQLLERMFDRYADRGVKDMLEPVSWSRDSDGMMMVHFDQPGATINATYYDYAQRTFKDPSFRRAAFQTQDTDPVMVYEDTELVGVVMPIREGVPLSTALEPLRTKGAGTRPQPTGKPRVIQQLKTKEKIGFIQEMSDGTWIATRTAGGNETFPDAKAARAWLRGPKPAPAPKKPAAPAKKPGRFADLTDDERRAEIARLRAARKAKMAGAEPEAETEPVVTWTRAKIVPTRAGVVAVPTEEKKPRKPRKKKDATAGTLGDAAGAGTAAKPKPTRRRTKPKTKAEAAEKLQSAGKKASQAMHDALSGLEEILKPDPNQIGMGLTFSDEQYERAKPMFQAAWKAAQESAWDFADFVEWLVDQLIEKFSVDVDAAYDVADRFTREQTEADNADPADGRTPTDAGTGTAERRGEPSDRPLDRDGEQQPGAGPEARPREPGDDRTTGDRAEAPRRAARPGEGDAVVGSGIGRGPHPDGPVGVGSHLVKAPPPDYELNPQRLAMILEGGAITAAENNVVAMETLAKLQREDRWPSQDEQEALAKWRGWGAADVNQFLDEKPRENWSDHGKQIHARIKALTTPNERIELRASAVNAHYTFGVYPPLWKALESYGMAPGLHILSPSIGSGHEFMTMPPGIRTGATMTAYEIEPATAQVAKYLTPGATVYAMPFESMTLPLHSQDVMITNVPFGNYPVTDPSIPRFLRQSIHNYFFAKATTLLQPGGLLAFITSHHSMDAPAHMPVRQWLAERMDFLGAVRLPNTAFQRGARTEVVTDIILMRRRAEGDDPTPQTQEFVHTTTVKLRGERYDKKAKKKVPIQKEFDRAAWYEKHPDLILGSETATGTMRAGEEYNVEGELDQYALAAALEKVLPPGEWEAPGRGIPVEEAKRVATEQPPGSFVEVDGDIKQVNQDGQLRVYAPVQTRGKNRGTAIDMKKIDRVRAHLQVKAALEDVLAAQTASDADLATAQKALRGAYDRFKSKWGVLNSQENRRAFGLDPASARLRRLETVEQRPAPKGKKKPVIEVVGLEPIFTERVARDQPLPSKIPHPRDALVASISAFAEINWRYMSEVSDKSIPELQTTLREARAVFIQADGTYKTRDDYLGGDVVSKLEVAEQLAEDDDRFKANVEELKKVQPVDLPVESISLTIGQPWIDAQYYADFIDAQLNMKTGIKPTHYDTGQRSAWTLPDVKNDYTISTAARAHPLAVKWVAGTYDFVQILKAKLNLQSPKLTYTVEEGDSKRTVTDEQGTLALAQAMADLDWYWEDWLSRDATRLKTLRDAFNSKFNRFAPREFDTTPIMPMIRRAGFDLQIEKDGKLVPGELRPAQKHSVYRGVVGGNSLIALDTGGGKTMVLLSIALLWKRTGRAHKPMLVVHDKTVPGFLEEAGRIFPGANALFLDAEALEDETSREESFAQAAYGNYDFIVITHNGFRHIRPSVAQQVELFAQFEADAYAALDRADKEEIKDLKREINRIKEKMEKAAEKQDSGITWDQMGVDAVLIDEAHAYKNLYFGTKLAGRGSKVKGIDPSESQRAFDAYAKITAINRMSNERNVVFSTATPVMNSPAEFYTMLRYLAPSMLRSLGLTDFDSFYAQFLDAQEIDDPRPDGSTRRLKAINRYKNLKTLHTLFSQVTDYVPSSAMPYLKLPKLKGGQVKTLTTPKHPIWDESVQPWIDRRMENYRQNPTYKDRQGRMHGEKKFHPFTGEEYEKYENVANIIDDSAAAALDLRLVRGFEGVKDYPESRVNQTADLVAAFYKRTTEETKTTPARGAAMVFADLGVPKKKDLEPLPFLEGIEAGEDEATEAEQEEADAQAVADLSNFNLYDALRDALVKRGVKRSEIAYVQQAQGDLQRKILYEKVRNGDIRILLGSTNVGGTGVNVHSRLGMLVHMDAPKTQRPGDLHQRNGRIIRQNNQFDEVEIIRFVTPGTADELKFSTIIRKAQFIEALMRGDVDQWEDVELSATDDLETARRLATGDMRVLELRELKQQKARLIAARHNDAQKARSQRVEVDQKKEAKKGVDQQIAKLQAFVDNEWEKQEGEALSLEVTDTSYRSRYREAVRGSKDANELLARLVKQFQNAPYFSEFYRVTLGGMKFSLELGRNTMGGNKVITGKFDDELTPRTMVRKFLVEGENDIPPAIATALAGYYNKLPDRIAKLSQQSAALETQIETLEHALATDTQTEAKLKQVDEDLAELQAALRTSEEAATEKMKKEAADRAASGAASFTGYDLSDLPTPATVRKAEGAASFAGYDPQVMPDPSLRNGGRIERPDRPEAEPVIDGNLVMPAGMPELNELIEAIGGHLRARVPKGAKRGVAGRFLAPGRILVHPDLFVIPKWRQQARAVVAHEIGHFIAWKPERTFRKGNVLGHIAGLPKFLKHTFVSKDGEEFKLGEIKAELIAWTQQWKPLSADPSEAELAYRYSSSELFADAISGLLMNPRALEATAPTFYRMLFKELPERSPEIYDAYKTVRERLAGPRAARVKHIRGAVQHGTQQGVQRRIDALREQGQWIKLVQQARWSPVETLKSQVIEPIFHHLVDLATKVRMEADRLDTPAEKNPYYDIWEVPWLSSRPFLREYFYPVTRMLDEVGLHPDHELHELLVYKRIHSGDRSEFLNVAGITADEAGDLYDNVLAGVTEEQRKALLDAMDMVYTGFAEAREEAFKAGMYSAELMDQMRSNEFYAPFQVADYAHNGMSWKVFGQTGSARPLMPAFGSAMLKAEAMLRAANTNKMRRKAMDWYQESFPGSAVPWKSTYKMVDGRFQLVADNTFRGKKKPRHLEPVRYYDSGKIRDFLVEPRFADAFMQNTTPDLKSAAWQGWKQLGVMHRGLVLTLSPGFIAKMMARDLWNIVTMHPRYRLWKMPNLIRNAVKALPMGVYHGFNIDPKAPPPKWMRSIGLGKPLDWLKEATGSAAKAVDEAERRGLLPPQMFVDWVFGRRLEGHDRDLIERAKKDPAFRGAFTSKRDRLRRAGEWLIAPFTGTVRLLEAWPRAIILQGWADEYGGLDKIPPDIRHALRAESGMPMYDRGGKFQNLQGGVFAFARGAIQGLYGDVMGMKREFFRTPADFSINMLLLMSPLLLNHAWRHGFVESAMRALGYGDDDEELQAIQEGARVLQGESEFNRRNYVSVPISGVDENGRGTTFSLPRGYGTIGIVGTLDAVLETLGDQKDDDLADVLQAVATSWVNAMPGLHFATNHLYNLGGLALVPDFAPRDWFRDQAIFTSDEQEFLSLPGKASRYVSWAVANHGLGSWVNFYRGRTPKPPDPAQPGVLDHLLTTHLVGPAVGSYFKRTSYGWREIADDAREAEDAADARRRTEARLELEPVLQEFEDQRHGTANVHGLRLSLARRFADRMAREHVPATASSETFKAQRTAYEHIASVSMLGHEHGPVTSLLYGTNDGAAAVARAWLRAGMRRERILRLVNGAVVVGAMSENRAKMIIRAMEGN